MASKGIIPITCFQNLSSDSQVETCRQTDRQTRLALYVFMLCASCKGRIIKNNGHQLQRNVKSSPGKAQRSWELWWFNISNVKKVLLKRHKNFNQQLKSSFQLREVQGTMTQPLDNKICTDPILVNNEDYSLCNYTCACICLFILGLFNEYFSVIDYQHN
jgi:hypothetical protein